MVELVPERDFLSEIQVNAYFLALEKRRLTQRTKRRHRLVWSILCDHSDRWFGRASREVVLPVFKKKIEEDRNETLTKSKTIEKKFDEIVQEIEDAGLIVIERKNPQTLPRKPGRPLRTFYRIPFVRIGGDVEYITPDELPAAFDGMQRAYRDIFQITNHLLRFVSSNSIIKGRFEEYSDRVTTYRVRHPPGTRDEIWKLKIPKMPEDAEKWAYVMRVR